MARTEDGNRAPVEGRDAAYAKSLGSRNQAGIRESGAMLRGLGHQLRGPREVAVRRWDDANRPVDNLKWTNNYTLSYERWTGPHFGHRYVVDIKQMKQTGAFILSDQ